MKDIKMAKEILSLSDTAFDEICEILGLPNTIGILLNVNIGTIQRKLNEKVKGEFKYEHMFAENLINKKVIVMIDQGFDTPVAIVKGKLISIHEIKEKNAIQKARDYHSLIKGLVDYIDQIQIAAAASRS